MTNKYNLTNKCIWIYNFVANNVYSVKLHNCKYINMQNTINDNS